MAQLRRRLLPGKTALSNTPQSECVQSRYLLTNEMSLSLKRARIVFLTSILDWERSANAISDNRALTCTASSSFMLLCSFFTCPKPTLISHSSLNPYCFFFSASYLCSLHHELQDLDPLVLHNIHCCRLMHSNLFVSSSLQPMILPFLP